MNTQTPSPAPRPQAPAAQGPAPVNGHHRQAGSLNGPSTSPGIGVRQRAGTAGPAPGEPGGDWDDIFGDWDDLLKAVRQRLPEPATGPPPDTLPPGNRESPDSARTPPERRGQAPGVPMLGSSAGHPRRLGGSKPAQVRASLLGCLRALDELHEALKQERLRRRRLERDVSDALAALARIRADLVGTQAGERQARHLALHDGLTALPNRRFFCEQVNLALAHARAQAKASAAGATSGEFAFSVLYLDLDGFKPVNDAHGHHVGDELLRIMGARLTRAVRSEDMMSRLGGDEFACLVTGCTRPESLEHLASTVLDAIAAPVTIGSLTFRMRASMGIAIYPVHGDSTEALLRSADAAMYRAKRKGARYAFSVQQAREDHDASGNGYAAAAHSPAAPGATPGGHNGVGAAAN